MMVPAERRLMFSKKNGKIIRILSLINRKYDRHPLNVQVLILKKNQI